MLQCLSFKSSTATSTSLPNSPPTFNLHNGVPLSQGTSAGCTPIASTQPSPTINLTREYTLAMQTDSYNEMWSRIHLPDDNDQIVVHVNHADEAARQLLLTQVLQPNRECVEEALRHARPNALTQLVSKYFDHSENATNSCLLLHQSLYRTRALYDPLHRLLDILPSDMDSLTQTQCDYAFDIFLCFDSLDNPFPCPDSQGFHQMRHCFSQLRQQLDHRLQKSRSRAQLGHQAKVGSVLCVIGSVVAVAISAVAIATHALAAIVAIPFCTVGYLPCDFTEKECAHVKQLDAAARGAYVLNNDLETIDCLVARLYSAVEDDKLLIRLGLERGRDKHPILEVLKQLRNNHVNFINQLKDLEEHICLCFSAVNRARSLLLQEIHLYQASS